MDIAFEPVSVEQVLPLAEIFNYYVEHSVSLFVIDPISNDEMSAMLFFSDARYAAFAILADKKLAGFISIHNHKQRAAYRDTAEITVYLAPEYTKRGIGSRALGYIEKYAQKNGFHVLLASIAGGNIASVCLFEKMNYIKVAHFKELGYKHGQWLDVLWYEKILQ